MPVDLEKARGRALRLLKFRPRSESELRSRLGRCGFADSTTEAVLAELKQKGLVNDALFARLFVTQKALSKPVGRRLLLTQLRAKGIKPELAAEAVAVTTEGRDEFEMARQLALGRVSRMRGLERAAIERRLFGFLSRRGFASDVVHRVVKEMTAEGGHPRNH